MSEKSTLDLSALNANKNIAARNYWKQRLNAFEWKSYFSRNGKGREPAAGRKYATCSFRDPGKASAGLHARAGTAKARQAVLLATLGIFIQKYSGDDDISIFIPLHHEKDPAYPDKYLIPVRMNIVSGLNFRKFLSGLSIDLMEDIRHGLYPLEKILHTSKAERSNLPAIGMLMEDMHAPSSLDDLSPGIIFSFSPDDLLSLRIRYDGGRYEEMDMARLPELFFNLLNRLLAEPEEDIGNIGLIPDEEKNHILHLFNDTEMNPPGDETILSVFERQVEKIPEHIAVICGKKAISYAELNEQAERMAAYLRQEMQVETGDLAGLMLKREECLMPSLLGIIKAGAAYIPIDPDYPDERIKSIIRDSGLKVLITREEYLHGGLAAGAAVVDLNKAWSAIQVARMPAQGRIARAEISGSHLAYVIYTSGSTGKPKGVMVEHHSVLNLIRSMQKKYPVAATDRYLMKTSFSFDVSVMEIFGWFTGGGAVALLDPGQEGDPAKIMDAIKDGGVTHVNFVPTLFSLFVDELLNRGTDRIETLKYIFLAGEALPTELARKFLALQLPVSLENLYGPTEATVYCCGYSIREKNPEERMPIGKPFGNVKLYITDRQFHLQPIGVPGELCVTGAGLARGYLHNPALTAEKFIKNPYSPCEWMYRTGDLARWLPDGNIEFLGRMDQQVKIRGFRIELGEIEHQLAKYERIKETVVVAKEQEGEKFLVAYYRSEGQLETGALRDFLAGNLPEYMIPSYTVRLDHFPLTPGGKLDRKALPHPEIRAGESYSAPVDDTERRLAEIWADILKIDKKVIGRNGNFFDLGGHSLRAMSLVNRVKEEMGVNITIRNVFERKNIQRLGELVRSSERSGKGDLKKAERKEYYDLSIAQIRLYYLYTFDKSTLAFNLPIVVKLTGIVDRDRMSSSFTALVNRHEAFRTSVRMVNDQPVQFISQSVDFAVEYCRATSEEVDPIINDFIRPFDLGRAPLFRVKLIAIGQDTHFLLVDMHHIISDGTSIGLLVNDFISLFNNAVLLPPKFNYKDFVAFQQSAAYLKRTQVQKDFWVRHFSDPIVPLDMPVDFARPPDLKGDFIRFDLDKEETRLLRLVGASEVATVSMVILAVLKVLLAKIAGQEDIVIGMVAGGRGQFELESIVGMFPVVLPIRSHPHAHLSFRDFLIGLKTTFLEALENQSYPYEELAKEINLVRNTGRNPWFDVMYLYQNYETSDLSLGGLTVSPYKEQYNVAQEKLNLTVWENEDRLSFRLVYSTALFRKTTMERFAGYFRKIVQAIGKDANTPISDIGLVQANGQQPWSGVTDHKTPIDRARCFSDLFRAQVGKTPLRVAVEHNGSRLTYADLENRSLRLAASLTAKGLGPGKCAVLFLNRGIDMLTAILAVFHSGGAYIPIDTGFPGQRIKELLSDSGAEIVIAERETIGRIMDLLPDIPAIRNIVCTGEEEEAASDTREAAIKHTDDLAYIIYTSGTTGKPKGAMIHQLGMINHLYALIGILGLHEGDVIAQTASPCFDISVWQFLVALLTGGKTYVIDKEKIQDPSLLLSTLRDGEVTVFQAVPSLLTAMLDDLPPGSSAALPSLRWMIPTGESLTTSLAQKWYSFYPHIRLLNAYGPAEASDDVTAYIADPPKEEHFSVPIGKPIQNMQVYVLDESLRICPPGVTGEICVAGLGVGKGYWKDEESTRKAFIPNPFAVEGEDPGYALLYKTGDRGYWMDDGNIMCMGRKDDQVKIRGFRIELGEIQGQLSGHDSIRDAVVIARELAGDKHLVGYYVADQEIPAAELGTYLAGKLPLYMVPSYFVRVDRFPLTHNGKINKRALPDPETRSETGYEPPADGMEKELVGIWAEHLNTESERIGVEDNFFKLGGHSLSAMRLMATIKRRLHIDIPISILFQLGTVRSMAQWIRISQNNQTDLADTYEEMRF